MANIFAWLLLAVGPLAKKILVALGIGWVSYQGVSTALDVMRDHIISSWGALSAQVANFLAYAGFGEAMGIVMGAIAARGALMLVQRLGKVAS